MASKYPFTQVSYSYNDVEHDMTLYEDGEIVVTSDAGIIGSGKWKNDRIEEFSADLSFKIQLGLECEMAFKLS